MPERVATSLRHPHAPGPTERQPLRHPRGAPALFAAATIWLSLTNPVTVADAVDTGEVSPLVEELATVLDGALAGMLKYL